MLIENHHKVKSNMLTVVRHLELHNTDKQPEPVRIIRGKKALAYIRNEDAGVRAMFKARGAEI
jgi:hypothetical protein